MATCHVAFKAGETALVVSYGVEHRVVILRDQSSSIVLVRMPNGRVRWFHASSLQAVS